MQFSHSLDLETEPFKNWDNIVCKTMGLASQRMTWRTQVKENFVLSGENYIVKTIYS